MQIHASTDFSGLMTLMAGYLSPGFCDCPHFGSLIQSQFFTATRLAFFSALAASSNIDTKVQFQRAGLGFGFLPRVLIEEDLKKGALIELVVEEARLAEPLWLAM